MGKKSGTAVSAESPKAPDEAQEPDVADPGEAAKIEAEQAKTEKLKPGSTTLERSSGSEEEESHWVGIKLKDDKGNPVPGEPFKLKLPDGTIVEGTLDTEGKAEVHGVPEGQSQVCFPKIDKDEWRPA